MPELSPRLVGEAGLDHVFEQDRVPRTESELSQPRNRCTLTPRSSAGHSPSSVITGKLRRIAAARQQQSPRDRLPPRPAVASLRPAVRTCGTKTASAVSNGSNDSPRLAKSSPVAARVSPPPTVPPLPARRESRPPGPPRPPGHGYPVMPPSAVR